MIEQRIAALRRALSKHGLAAYIVPSSDPHQSEYVADHWKIREWLSGFTGSAGVLVVTEDHAGLWTDSRYFLQAEQQLQNREIELHKQKIPHAPEHVTWLTDHLPAGSDLGCDGSLFSVGQINYLERQLSRKGISVHAGLDLVSDLWPDRPPLPKGQVFVHEDRFAGQARREKLNSIRRKMAEAGAASCLVSTLDDISWTLNLRGNDVEFNPVFISYLWISDQNAVLFVNAQKIPTEIRSALEKDGVNLEPYAAVESFLEQLPAGDSVLIHPASINFRLFQALTKAEVIRGENIPSLLKAVKNEVEIDHIRNAMVKDGLALVKLYRWLEAVLNNRTVTEFELSQQLDHFRRTQPDYHGESFAAIVGYNANGAIIHYRPAMETSAEIRPDGLLLLDSGAQYTDGTTDITRTITLDEATGEQRLHFTLVLKGHIALARVKFPAGTTGAQLDGLARLFLWEHGLNYGHGTGHGVGFFLNVHEPPQGFVTSAATPRGTTPFEPGMITSNEPGFYKDGAYGIRIENLVLCVKEEKTAYGDFLRFETLTLFPIDLRLIDPSLLTQQEKDWLNDYHRMVFHKLSRHLVAEELKWLEAQCRALD